MAAYISVCPPMQKCRHLFTGSVSCSIGIYLTFQELMAEGHSAVQLLLQLHDKLVEEDKLGDNQKSVIFEKIAVSYISPQQSCFLLEISMFYLNFKQISKFVR